MTIEATVRFLSLSFKLSFLMRLIVGAGSGDPEQFFSYAAKCSGCWVISHSALSPMHLYAATFSFLFHSLWGVFCLSFSDVGSLWLLEVSSC